MIHVYDRGERMRKMLILLLIVGILVLGTISVLEDAYEETIKNIDFSDSGDLGDFEDGEITPDGGGSGGAGPAPG